MTRRLTTDLIREAYQETGFRPLQGWHLNEENWLACPSTAVAVYLGAWRPGQSQVQISARLGGYGFSPRYLDLFNLFWDCPEKLPRNDRDAEFLNAWTDANQARELLSERGIVQWSDSTESTGADTVAGSVAEPGIP